MKLGQAIAIRVLAPDAKLIQKAAKLVDLKVATFVREAAVREAKRLLDGRAAA